MSVKRRIFIRAVSFFAAICVILAAEGLSEQKARASYEETLGKMRLGGLTSLCEFSRDISVGLRLLAVSADNSMSDSAAYVGARVTGAIGCLNSFESANVKNISEFLNGTESFVQDFSGSEAQRKAAVMLSDYAQEMYYHLNDLTSSVMNEKYSLTEYSSLYAGERMPYYEEYLDFSNGSENDIFKMITPASAQFRESEFLSGKGRISQKEAVKTASGIMSVNAALWRSGKAKNEGVEVYSLTYDDFCADICKVGGALCRLVRPMPCLTSVYSVEEAERKAIDFADANGYRDLTTAEVLSNGFEASFNMFPVVNGILLLNARIDISVCLASGEITYFDASEYIKNFRNDVAADIGNPDLSMVLPENLNFEKCITCISEIGGRDILCYLAVCDFEGDTVLSYIDASDFEVLKTEIKYAKMQ